MIFDADNHYYEPKDCFTRHFPRDRMDEAIRVVPVDGGEQLMVGPRPYTFFENPFPERWSKPGGLREMLRQMKAGLPAQETVPAPAEDMAAFVSREPRLARLDQQGVDACVLFPTLAVCVEHFMNDSPERTMLNVRSFNRWLLEDWGFGGDGRIYGVPLFSLLDLDSAVVELEWALAQGARFIHLRPGPQGGRNPADPYFDPFWARVNDAGVSVAFHIGESGYNERYSADWGEEPNPSSHRQSAFQWTCFYGDLPIMHTIAGLILGNLFGRFPNISVMSVENGSLWVPYLLAAMDKMKGMGRNGPWPGGYVPGRPSDVFRQHVSVSPFHEEDAVALARLIGVDRVLFGSDYPHVEGLAEPLDFREGLAGLTDDEQTKIMGGNLMVLAGRS